MAGLMESNQSGRRQDLADLIAVADAKGTPFTTMIKKGKDLVNSLFTWQADSLSDPNTDGALDGKDVADYENAAENRAELSNRLQIFQRTAKVSTLSQVVSDVAGVGKGKEMARAKAKKLQEVKRDMEATFLSDNDAQAQSGINPYKTRGLGSWIQNSAQSYLPVPEVYRTPAASINTTAMSSFAESDLQNVLKSIYEQTGVRKRLVLLCGSTLKSKISDFTKWQPGVSSSIAAIRTYNQDAKSKMIMATVDFYEGDFAELELIPDLFLAVGSNSTIRNARGYVIDPDDVELRYGELPNVKDLPDGGGGERCLIRAIAGLAVGNPLNNGKFAATA